MVGVAGVVGAVAAALVAGVSGIVAAPIVAGVAGIVVASIVASVVGVVGIIIAPIVASIVGIIRVVAAVALVLLVVSAGLVVVVVLVREIGVGRVGVARVVLLTGVVGVGRSGIGRGRIAGRGVAGRRRRGRRGIVRGRGGEVGLVARRLVAGGLLWRISLGGVGARGADVDHLDVVPPSVVLGLVGVVDADVVVEEDGVVELSDLLLVRRGGGIRRCRPWSAWCRPGRRPGVRPC